MRTSEQISIDAPSDVVWAVLADVARWPEWTASVRTVTPLQEGPLALGARYRIRQPRLPVAVWTVTELVPGTSFTWVNRSPGLRSSGSHVIAPDGVWSTASLAVEQVGPLSPLLRPYARLVTRYVHLEAVGLKARSEGLRQDAGTTTST